MYDFGSRLKEIRKRRRLTQKMLAARINKSVAAISGYESDVQCPPTDVLVSMSEVLHVPITYFLDLESAESFTTKGLSTEQKKLIDLLFEEFVSPSTRNDELSLRQIEILRRLMVLFSKNI
jgi:transcriptional regulator with XRE-family HTH domain